MTASRLTVAFSLLIAPTATLVAQIVLQGMPPAETALERIRLAPEAWSLAHLLLALAAVGWIIAGFVLCERTVLSLAAFVTLSVGVVVASTINGIDAVLGVLAGTGADGSIHRAIAENLVQPLDQWDFALTIGLVALVAARHAHGTLPWWGPVAALVGLAVPAFTEVRVVAAVAVLLGFMILAASLLRPVDAHRQSLAPSAVAVLAFLPAAFFSVERAILLGVVLVVVAIGLFQARRTLERA